MKIPTLTEILKSLPSASTWSWHRDGAHLAVQHESLAEDRRTCVDVILFPHRIEIRVAMLSGFDKEKDKWTTYESNQQGDAPNRRGEKALREYIKAYALNKKGVPNPTSVSFYRAEGEVTNR